MNKLILIFLAIFSFAFNANAFVTNAKQAVLLDVETSEILFGKNSDKQMVPSSMTKLMTVYVVFERLKNDVLRLDDKFTVSEKAWRKGGSKMFLRHTDRVSVEELLNGIIVQSGNDACIVVAEGVASSEENFVALMNKTAKKLGMNNSHFMNATGWPDAKHYMSAHDIAILSARLIKDFPEYYNSYFGKKEYTYSKIKQKNRNLLLWRNSNVDGLKTGHTDDGGYGIAASAKQNDRRIIAVVNGLKNELSRADEAQKLLNYGFRYFTKRKLFEAGKDISSADVWLGTSENVSLTTLKDVNIIVPKMRESEIKIEVSYDGPVPAPIKNGQQIGTLRIIIPDMAEKSLPLYANQTIEKAGIFPRLKKSIEYYLHKFDIN